MTPRATTISSPIRPPPANTAGRLRGPNSGAPIGAPEFFPARDSLTCDPTHDPGGPPLTATQSDNA